VGGFFRFVHKAAVVPTILRSSLEPWLATAGHFGDAVLAEMVSLKMQSREVVHDLCIYRDVPNTSTSVCPKQEVSDSRDPAKHMAKNPWA